MRLARVLLADDHPLVRSGVRAALEAQGGLRVVAEAEDAAAALDLARRLKPDLVLLDLSMPGDAFAALARLARLCRVVVLSMHGAPEHIRMALALGARGYVLKEDSPRELARVLRDALDGRPGGLSARAGRALRDGAGSGLTAREREVLALVAKGLTSRQLASRLGISARTVETHRQRLMRKTGARNVAELVRLALSQGFLGAGPIRPGHGA
jgi:DNA-binding NarL/FixJ family response regulator